MSIRTIRKSSLLAASIAILGGLSGSAYAVDMETLIDKMHEKGLLKEDEYQEMRNETRTGRRKRALEEAQIEEKANKAREENQLTGRFRDGFVFESADKQHSIAISGRVHADYRRFSEDSGSTAAANANSANTFDIRRAYLGVTGKLYQDWTFEVTSDLAADTLEYAWLNYKFSDAVQARIGAFKMPFSYEELTSSRLIDFQERSLINVLVPGKEQGVSIYGAPVNWLSYALAYSNGNGKEGDETNAVVDEKETIARLAINLAELAGIDSMVLHLGAGFSRGTMPVAAPTGTVRTEGRGLQFFNAAAFTGEGGAGLQKMDRDRRGLEAIVAWGPFKLQGESVKASWDGTSAAGADFGPSIDASYVAASWLITGEKYVNFYSLTGSRNLVPNRAFKKGGDGWGAWELGVRLSKFDAGDFTTTNPAGTGVLAANCNGGGPCTSEVDSKTVSLKWIPHTNLRVYLNYVKTEFDTPVGNVVKDNTTTTTDDETAVTMRVGMFF